MDWFSGHNCNRDTIRKVGAVAGTLVCVALLSSMVPLLQGCGGCVDPNDLHDLTVEPEQPCLELELDGLCYGVALGGSNGCAESLVLPGEDESEVTVLPGEAIDFSGPWEIITESGTFSSTDHYTVDGKLGETPITISFSH